MTGVWKSQRFDAEGSSTAPGILRQLGRPALDEFVLLVRESAQNSWDARRPGRKVDFTLRLERLGLRSGAWRDALLPSPSENTASQLENALSSDSWLLTVSDRGTYGLGGPIRATERPLPGERTDFVQFLRNVGEPRDVRLGGGTYGFGKGVFYRASSARTIIASTNALTSAGEQRRLMGASLGEDFYDSTGVRYTGRHWWGRVGDDGVVDPLLGSEATSTSEDLGLPRFESGSTGSDIAMVGINIGLDGPEAVTATPERLANHLASAILWNLWPKVEGVAPLDAPAMSFHVLVEGEEIGPPDPNAVLSLAPFVAAFHALSDGSFEKYERSSTPRLTAGRFAVAMSASGLAETSLAASAKPFDGAPHHVARMRQAGLVVDYLPGPPSPDPLFCYAGVFEASAEADPFFSAAEPPTHDAWNPEGLERNSRLVVNGAREFIRKSLSRRFGSLAQPANTSSTDGLGRASQRLSRLVSDVTGTGAAVASRSDPRERSGSTPVIPKAVITGEPWISELGDGIAVFVRVFVPASSNGTHGHLDVVLGGGGRETSAPLGAFVPSIKGWLRTDDPAIWVEGATLEPSNQDADWLLVGDFDDGIVTRFRVDQRVSKE